MGRGLRARNAKRFGRMPFAAETESHLEPPELQGLLCL